MSHSSDNRAVSEKLLRDCLILLVSLVLSDPKITPKQSKMVGNLIRRARQHLHIK